MRFRQLVAAIRDARLYGLDPDDYALRRLQDEGLPAPERERLARESFVSLATDIRDGRTSPRLTFTEDEMAVREGGHPDLLRALAGTEDVQTVIRSLRSDNPLQEELTRALHLYQDYAATGGFPQVTISGDLLERGDTGQGVESVAERLRREGFLHPATRGYKGNGAVYDRSLEDAVKRFQRSRGLTDDGIVGPETVARMNETAEELVDQIQLNLERARWLPQEFEETYVLVNAAAFAMTLHHHGRVEDRIDVVVGTRHDQTPVFADMIEHLVINPYWNVPESILREEIAPKVARDLSYLDRKGYEAVRGWGANTVTVDPASINWGALPADLSFRVRQKPSPTNALGEVKFMFPNKYAVYLHDTPADALFDRTTRTFSHGCIRVERPRDFASWLLTRTGGDLSAVDQIGAPGRNVVRLPRHVPVYVTYMTVETSADGTVFFYDDVYGRDDDLAAAMGGIT